MSSQERRLAAIVSADVVGYSRLMGRDEAGTLAAFKRLRADLIDPSAAAHGGRIFKTMGDGLLLEFPSVVDAARCVVAIQRGIAGQLKTSPEDRPIVLRVGLNLGDVIVEDGDVFGDGVNVAARLQALAQPGGVCFSHRVYEEVRDRLDLSFEDGGEQTLKNIALPLRIWHWSPGGAGPKREIDVAEIGRSLAAKPSLAVLPFVNLSRDPEQDYFADGVAEDTIAALSRFHELRVVARSSSFTFKGSALDIAAIARQLGVQYVLGGSIRRSGDRIRLSAELTNAGSGMQVWSDRFDRALIDILDLQDEVSRAVAAVVHPAVRGAEIERAHRKPPENLSAYDLYLRALPHAWAGTRDDMAKAIDLLRQSLAHDDSNAASVAMLAWCCFAAVTLGVAAPKSKLEEALALARRAVNLDATDAFVQAVYGTALARVSSDCAQGLLHADEAVRLNPSSAFAWSARGLVAHVAGEFAQATESFELAIRLSPNDVFLYLWHTFLSAAHLALGRHGDGVASARKAVQRNPHYGTAHRVLAANLALSGQLEQAREATRQRDQTQKTSLKELKALHLFEQEAIMDRYLAALRSCGVPD